jgi:hypothetical protein
MKSSLIDLPAEFTDEDLRRLFILLAERIKELEQELQKLKDKND